MLINFLATPEGGASWNFCSMQSRVPVSAIQRLLWYIMGTVTDVLQDRVAVAVAKTERMKFLEDEKCHVSYHFYARCATNVLLQYSTKLSRSHGTAKYWFRKDHEMYGLKTWISVIPDRL